MIEKLSKRDIRILKIGAVCAVAILVFVFASDWLEHWAKVRNETAQLKNKLDLIDIEKAKRTGLMSIVPKFEMPLEQEKQMFLFRDKLNEQFKSAGINSKPLQVASVGKSGLIDYRLLRLKTSAKCNFAQVLDLLANLKDNPYLVGIEEMRIKCDTKNPQDVELDLTVSTFVKVRKGAV